MPAASPRGPRGAGGRDATGSLIGRGCRPAALTLTYDDGRYNSLNKLEALHRTYGLFGTIGVISSCPERRDTDPDQPCVDATDGSPHRLLIENAEGNEKSPVATWKELRGFVNNGYFDLASHSHTHPYADDAALTRLAQADVEFECSESKRVIELETGSQIDAFIYPHYKDNDMVQVVAAKFYGFARAGDDQINPLDTREYYHLRAWTVGTDTNPADINATLDQTIQEHCGTSPEVPQAGVQ